MATNELSIMQNANRLRKSMERGASMGFWQMLPGSNLTRLMSRAGCDWLLVDQEHGNIDDGAMHEAVAAAAACRVSPIVRIPDNQGWMVKRALDAGAHGIMVPLLRTPEDAKRLVQSAKFPSQNDSYSGQRGFGSPFPMERFHPELGSSDYLQQANEALLTIVQIETKEAVENLEAIANTPGIDVLFVGPFDLGNNIGYPIIDGVMHERLHETIANVHSAAQEAGKKSGIFCTSGAQAGRYREQGFNMISCATDMMLIPVALETELAAATGSKEPAAKTGSYGK